MKVIVIGLGSMGKRRIRLLKERKDVEIFGIDTQMERVKQVTENLGISCYTDLQEAIDKEKPSCAFVCTSPLSHAKLINLCLQNKLHVFTEINLVSDLYDENIKLAHDNNCVLFLSSTFLYEEDTKAIINKVRPCNEKLNYIYHVGQYLPDWHPWESYNNYFIGNPRTNGCREIMAIDMPWLVSAFGDIAKVSAIKSKNTGLNIDYADNYLITIEHETGAKGVFAVDVVSRKATRHLEVYGEKLHLTWNGTSDSLYEYDYLESKKDLQVKIEEEAEHVDGYADFITENPYREEINAFFNQVENGITPDWDFEKDKTLLSIIDEIEQ